MIIIEIKCKIHFYHRVILKNRVYYNNKNQMNFDKNIKNWKKNFYHINNNNNN